MAPLAEWELEIIRRSLAMSSTLPADQAMRLVEEVERLLEELAQAREVCCREGDEGHG